MEDFDVSENKMSESAQRVVDRAAEQARRRRQPLTNPHILIAFADVETGLFGIWMRDVGVDPDDIRQATLQHIDRLPSDPHAEMRLSPSTKLLFKLAFHHAARRGRAYIGSIDLFSAIFEESQGDVAAVLRQRGLEPEIVISRGISAMRTFEAREERAEQQRRAALGADWKRYRPERYRMEAGAGESPLVEEVEPRSLKRRFLDLIGFRRRTRT